MPVEVPVEPPVPGLVVEPDGDGLPGLDVGSGLDTGSGLPDGDDCGAVGDAVGWDAAVAAGSAVCP